MKIKSRKKGKGKLNVMINLSKEAPEILNKTFTILLQIQRKKMNRIKRKITFKLSAKVGI